MEITHTDISVTFDGRAIEFDPYYFALAGELTDRHYRDVFSDCVRQWASLISTQAESGKAAYLPIGVYDECMEVLVGTILANDRVRIDVAWTDENGYAIDLNRPNEYITADHNVTTTGRFAVKAVGEYDRTRLTESLAAFIDQMTRETE